MATCSAAVLNDWTASGAEHAAAANASIAAAKPIFIVDQGSTRHLQRHKAALAARQRHVHGARPEATAAILASASAAVLSRDVAASAVHSLPIVVEGQPSGDEGKRAYRQHQPSANRAAAQEPEVRGH
jgi:hypothetical protein